MDSAFVALNRFGLGRRPDDGIPADPHAWLRAQLDAPDPAPVQGPDTASALGTVNDRIRSQEARKQATPPAAGQDAMPANPIGVLARQEAQAFLGRALVTPAPFRERLVRFWANHFTIAARGPVPSACCGAFIREAIRPHVTGRFSEMLLAVMRHPAMLAYLNQERSAGPESPAGQRGHAGLNENLARECLELHTIGPDSGYTQPDVTNFARILTGWSIEVRGEPRGFRFRPFMHEPGEIEMLGQTWPAGEAGGLAVLAWLGTHPAAYRHLAVKLVRHFTSDEPAQGEVHRIEAVLRDTRGDLGEAAAMLVELPGAWTHGSKLRTPQEFAIAALRAVGAVPEQVPNLPQIVAGLGQGVFQAPFPIGWPDRAADWSGPEAMLQRVDFAYGLAGRSGALDPEAVGHTILGPLLTEETIGQVHAAGSRRDGLTLLLSSPEFQRR